MNTTTHENLVILFTYLVLVLCDVFMYGLRRLSRVEVNYYYHSDPVDSKLFFSNKRTMMTINEPDSDINDYYHHYRENPLFTLANYH